MQTVERAVAHLRARPLEPVHEPSVGLDADVLACVQASPQQRAPRFSVAALRRRGTVMGMAIYGVDHVQLAMPAGCEEVAARFYAGLLGLPRVAKPPHLEARGGCWFSNGDVALHLGVEADFRPARKAHPALLVDDLEALEDALRAGGAEVFRDQPLAGFDRCYVDDPFGNRIELMQPV